MKIFFVSAILIILTIILIVSLTFSAYALAFISLIGLFPIIIKNRLFFNYFIPTYVIIFLITIFTSINTISLGMTLLGDKIEQNGSNSLSLTERTGVYASLLFLTLGGLTVGVPYAATENLLLLIPAEEDRVWQSQFPLKSAKIKKIIKSHKYSPEAKTYLLRWNSYCEEHCDIGYALNFGELTVKKPTESSCNADVKIYVSYSKKHRRSKIFDMYGQSLTIDQSVFWALQDLGWIFPYTLKYQFRC